MPHHCRGHTNNFPMVTSLALHLDRHGPHQVLVDTLTLLQSRGANYVDHILMSSPSFKTLRIFEDSVRNPPSSQMVHMKWDWINVQNCMNFCKYLDLKPLFHASKYIIGRYILYQLVITSVIPLENTNI